MLICLPAGKRKTPVACPFPCGGGAGFSGEPQVFVSADTRQKPLSVKPDKKGKQGKVLNLGHLDFDIVSTTRCPVEDFVLRISYFASLGISTLVESALQIRLFMQNKAKFRKSQMNINKVLTKDYENETLGERGKNKPNSNPIKANFKKAKMNVTSYITKGYENKPPIRAPKKQSQFSKRQKPMQSYLPKGIMKKTAISGSDKTNPNKPNFRGVKMLSDVLTQLSQLGGEIAILKFFFLHSVSLFHKTSSNLVW